MPYPQSKFAPSFSGEVDQDVKDFLDEYKEKANENNLTATQKVETVIWYVIKTQHHIWKSLPGYIDCDWGDLQAQLCQQYVNPSTEGQFSKQKLVDFVDKYAQKHMDDKADIINYYRQFNTKGKFLLNSGRVTQGEFNAIFWHGFHREDWHALHERLITKQPNRPQGWAFDIQDVLNIARAVFWVTTTFIHRSCPLRGTTSTARKNKGWSIAHATYRRQIAMDVLPGAYVPTNLHPLKVKSRRIKRLLTAIKSNKQVGGTSTH